jgi:hypothetical protein
MNTRNFGIALVAGLTFAVLGISSVNAENIEVVGSSNGCSTSYVEFFDTNGDAYSAITMSCPRPGIRVAALHNS